MKALRMVGRAAPIQILKAAALSWFNDRAPSMGAAIAYYTIFSLAPMLWLISAIVGLAFGESAARGAIAHQLQYAIGTDAAKALEAMVQSRAPVPSAPPSASRPWSWRRPACSGSCKPRST